MSGLHPPAARPPLLGHTQACQLGCAGNVDECHSSGLPVNAPPCCAACDGTHHIEQLPQVREVLVNTQSPAAATEGGAGQHVESPSFTSQPIEGQHHHLGDRWQAGKCTSAVGACMLVARSLSSCSQARAAGRPPEGVHPLSPKLTPHACQRAVDGLEVGPLARLRHPALLRQPAVGLRHVTLCAAGGLLLQPGVNARPGVVLDGARQQLGADVGKGRAASGDEVEQDAKGVDVVLGAGLPVAQALGGGVGGGEGAGGGGGSRPDGLGDGGGVLGQPKVADLGLCVRCGHGGGDGLLVLRHGRHTAEGPVATDAVPLQHKQE